MNEPESTSQFETYKRMLRYLKPLRWQFAVSLIGFAIFASTQPMLAKFFELVLTALENQDQSARVWLPVSAVGIFVIRGIGSFLGTYYNAFVGASVVNALKQEIFQHLTVLPAEYFDHTRQGQILHRLNSATGQVKAAITDALKTLVREGLTVIFLLGYVFYLNWKLSLTFLFIAPVLALLVRHTTKRFRNIARKNESALGNVMQVSKELVSNYPVVRAYGAQAYETQRFASALRSAFKTQMKIRRTAAVFTPLTQIIVASGIAIIVFLILSPTMLENYTTAELVGYLTAMALIPKPFRQLSGVNLVIQRGMIGAEMVFKTLDKEPEPDNGSYEAETIRGDIEIKDLHFTYARSERPAINGISLSIKAGEMIALVGESGSGKSTLASLLVRSYYVDDGSIFIDGVDINEYKLKNLRQKVSIVDQNIFLFNDTVKNNIAYGDHPYTDEEILRALKLAHCEDFVDKLGDGINTIIGDNGVMLSGGQRQRLSIARAFLKNSPLLILDEATSALDNESEKVIKQATAELAENRTTIVIAHRLSTIEQADRLIVMRDGQIIEQGSHQELLEKEGYYSRLFLSQYTKTDEEAQTV